MAWRGARRSTSGGHRSRARWRRRPITSDEVLPVELEGVLWVEVDITPAKFHGFNNNNPLMGNRPAGPGRACPRP